MQNVKESEVSLIHEERREGSSFRLSYYNFSAFACHNDAPVALCDPQFPDHIRGDRDAVRFSVFAGSPASVVDHDIPFYLHLSYSFLRCITQILNQTRENLFDIVYQPYAWCAKLKHFRFVLY